MTDSTISITVDPTNPGQFFACCGLLEIADRLTGESTGWFHRDRFLIETAIDLPRLIDSIIKIPIENLEPTDDKAPPLLLKLSERPLRLDWWTEASRESKGLKLWAGSMSGIRITRAMQQAIALPVEDPSNILNFGTIVRDPENIKKKVEPFYFDSRRGPNSHSRDVGFSTNDLKLSTTTYPAVEFLCLVGLQRARPKLEARARHYTYSTWKAPIEPLLLPHVISGQMSLIKTYTFESWFCTGQKKHKAFLTAQEKS